MKVPLSAYFARGAESLAVGIVSSMLPSLARLLHSDSALVRIRKQMIPAAFRSEDQQYPQCACGLVPDTMRPYRRKKRRASTNVFALVPGESPNSMKDV